MDSVRNAIRRFGAVATTLLLLASAAAYRGHYQVAPGQTADYHQRVRAAAEAMPLNLGSWMGQDVPVAAGAVALLHPNVIISRHYVDLAGGPWVNFLLVQCSDARDILGHYPPVCYVVHGWTLVSSEPRQWVVRGAPINGMEYEFSKLSLDEVAHVVVYDFMLLPDGQTCRQMDSVETAARAYPTRFFGAAQVQSEFDAAVPLAERDRIFQTMLAAAKPVLDQIGSRATVEKP